MSLSDINNLSNSRNTSYITRIYKSKTKIKKVKILNEADVHEQLGEISRALNF